MNCYMIIEHLDADKIKGYGTMTSIGTIFASTDEDAMQQIVDHFGIKDPQGDLSDNWAVENKQFSVVKLVPPTDAIKIK
jgi:hypothetical protein